jgi:hypothetical protein
MLSLGQRLADRLAPELREDGLQGANPRRQRITIVRSGGGQKGGVCGGFVFGKVKVLHNPDDIGLLMPSDHAGSRDARRLSFALWDLLASRARELWG